jgi:hypothetical protein
MSLRFQFSLGRLLASVALFCVALLLWRLLARTEYTNEWLFMAFTVALFSSAGALIGRPIGCALSVVFGWTMIFVYVLIWAAVQ